MRQDVHRLGMLVGRMLAEQGGYALLQQVERIRRAAIARREHGLDVDSLRQELAHDPVLRPKR